MRLSSSSPWGRPSTPASRDWARHGHATTPLTSIYRARTAPTGATSRGRRRFSRRVHRTAGTVALLVVALVSSGSVLALRDALFPDTGDETSRSIWRNPGRTAAAQIGPVASATVVGGDLKPLSIPLVTARRRDSTSVPSTTPPTRQTRPTRTTTPAVETTPIDVSLGVGQTSRSATATIAVIATTLPGGNSTTTIDTTPEATGPTPTGPSSTSVTTSNRRSGTTPSNTASSTTEKAPAAPAPFSKTYTATGGSINVTWTGSRLALDAVSPATGYRAEIEENERDRVRVDFEGDDAASRIEIRFENGRISIDNDND